MKSSAQLFTVVEEVLARHAGRDGALLPILHDVQHAIGHIPTEVLPQIAAALNLSRAEVHGVVTYYAHFRCQPPGRHVLQVCRAEACQAMGGETLLAHARQQLGCSAGQTTSADGEWTVEPVYCLGLCAQSPSAMLGDRLHARLTPRKLDTLIERESAR